jgi:hypothetical protein
MERVDERARRHLVGVVMVIYLLVIFEGSLRKWLLPQFSLYLFFIRDPFLLYAYVHAWRHGLWPRHSAWLQLSWAAAGVGVGLGLLQAVVGGSSDTRLLLAVYGWRAYFLYLPLAFLVGAEFQRRDIERVARLTLALSVPIAVLVVLQFNATIDSPINVGLAAETELQFRGLGLNGEHTRPMGPFSSGAGQQQFVATAWALLLACLVARWPLWPLNKVWLAVCVASVATCLALSGSRGTVLQCALIACFALGLGLVGRGAALRARALLLPAALGTAAVLLYPLVFPVGFAAFVDRWNGAEIVESGFQGGVFGRALYGFVDFFRLMDRVPVLGWGLGYGGNASINLHAEVDGIQPGLLAETDFARHMVDLGPALGLAFIALRIALVVWLARQVWRATRRAPDPMPMMLFAYVSYVVLLGTITGQGAINVYAWLFTGLCIAACRPVPAGGSRQAPGPVLPPVTRPRGRAPA